MSQSEIQYEEGKGVRFNDEQDEQVAQSRYYDQDGTFITNNGMIWKAFDFLFPAGKLAKLVRIYDTNPQGFPWGEIQFKLKLTEGFPVVNLIGAKESGRGKFYAGIARAAFNCDAIILDSGIATGIEKYAIRRGVKLIGVAPEKEIKFPKINPTYVDPLELSNGHTHLFLLNSEENDFEWTQEVWFKMDLAQRLAEGRGPKGSKRMDGKPRCKIVNILLGDTPYYYDEVKLAIKYNLPIIVVKGSPICNALIAKYAPKNENAENEEQNNEEQEQQQEQQDQPMAEISPEMLELMDSGNGHFFYLDSNDSEDIAQFVHFLLTVTPYEDGSLQKPDVKELEEEARRRELEQNSDEEQQNQQQDPNNNQSGMQNQSGVQN